MNCPNCGTALPQGAQTCPACGAFVAGTSAYPGYPPQNGGYSQGFDPTAYRNGGYPQGYAQTGYGQSGYPQGYEAGYGQNGYPQGFDPTAYGQAGYSQGYGGYPQGYQQPYGYYSGGSGGHGAFLSTLGYLPRVLSGMIRDPGETLQGMMERGDIYTGGVVAGLTLLLTFLTAIIFSRGAVSALFGGLSGLLNLTLANDAASMNQGVNYIAGKIAAPVGGIAALCQLFALVLPAAVAMVYLCAVRKVRFSFLLVSNFVAVTTLPSIAGAILCMLLSLLSPFAGIVAVLLSDAAGYVMMCLMIVHITGQAEPQGAGVKVALVCAAIVIKYGFILLIGGALMGTTMRTVAALVSSMGSLL